MFITPPERNHTRSANADWMELKALRSSTRRATIGDIIGIFDINDDVAVDYAFSEESATDERHDESILESRRNQLVDIVFDELQYRERVLGDAYPFSVRKTPPALDQVDDILSMPGRVVYLFCLLASAIRENRVQPRGLTFGARTDIANLFQVCACLAAGGYIVGDVASFGFPRATGNDFLPALRDTYQRFGAGVVRSTVPPGHPTATKDDGIDVVAWRDHPDRMPGKLYLLGQCASGRKWHEKSVVDRIPQFHGWFSTPPAAHYLPSMFIPFTLHRDLSDDPGTAFDKVLANKYLREERRYGIVFDRFRIAHFAGACLNSKNDEPSQVDGRDRFCHIQAWVEATFGIPGFLESV
jgi:hypothetical protein